MNCDFNFSVKTFPWTIPVKILGENISQDHPRENPGELLTLEFHLEVELYKSDEWVPLLLINLESKRSVPTTRHNYSIAIKGFIMIRNLILD